MKYQINYEEIYNRSPDMCLSAEAGTGRIIECNQTLLDTLGYTKEEVLEKTVVEMYHPDEHEKVKENLANFSKTGKLVHTELLVMKKDGDTIEVSLKFSPVKDEEGKILYSNAVWRDITEFKRVQRFLRDEKERSEELLLNILPKSIVERLKKSPAIIADGLSNATILFCDIRGFTKLSMEVSPDQLISMLNIVFSEFDHLVSFYGLEKIKTIGDAYMVASGLPLPREDHAEVAACLALDMKQALNHLNQILDYPLDIRIGINSGPVVAGVIGKKKFSYDLWGEAVNTASRMESHGVVGEIQIGETTHELIKDKFQFEDRGVIDIKGRQPMRAYLLKGRLETPPAQTD